MRYNKPWAVRCQDSKFNEAIQRIAFSFGYAWNSINKTVQYSDARMLFFHPEDKVITYSYDNNTGLASVVVNTVSEAMDLFVNPPSNLKKAAGMTLNKDGSVLVEKLGVYTKNEFDEVVETRKTFLGDAKKETLPKVDFKYLTNKGHTDNNIAVISMNNGNLEGYDLNDCNRIKTFSVIYIVGPIRFNGFWEKKN